MHTADSARRRDSGGEIFELLFERRDGFFEHLPVCGGSCAAEVVARTCPRQFEGAPPLRHCLLFRCHLRAGFDLSSGGLFLLGFNRLGFKSASHCSNHSSLITNRESLILESLILESLILESLILESLNLRHR
jgi:hypothetical protein